MHRDVGRLLVLILAACIVAPALAAEGRTPVFLPGSVLAADGKYFLSRNIIGPAGPFGLITICGANVDLDLNGMLVMNTGGGPTIFAGAGPPICPPGPADHVTIRNGVIAGGDRGIDVPGYTRKVDIEDVKIKDTGPGGGINMVEVEGTAIRRVEITDSLGPGIVWVSAVVKHGSIEHNLIRRTADSILVVTCSSLAVLNNRIEEGPGTGILLDTCGAALVAENTVERKGAQGIAIRRGRGNKLLDNLVVESGSNGIHLDQDTVNTLVLNNNSSNNGIPGSVAHGLMVQGRRNLIERNVLNDNSSHGLVFLLSIGGGGGCENTYGRNTARGNFGAAALFCAPAPPGQSTPNFCDAAGPCGNTSYGDNLMPGPPIG